MANHIVNQANPTWVEVNHGATYVSLAIRDFKTGDTAVIVLTSEQAHAVGGDLVGQGAVLASEQALAAQGGTT